MLLPQVTRRTKDDGLVPLEVLRIRRPNRLRLVRQIPKVNLQGVRNPLRVPRPRRCVQEQESSQNRVRTESESSQNLLLLLASSRQAHEIEESPYHRIYPRVSWMPWPPRDPPSSSSPRHSNPSTVLGRQLRYPYYNILIVSHKPEADKRRGRGRGRGQKVSSGVRGVGRDERGDEIRSDSPRSALLCDPSVERNDVVLRLGD